MKPSHIEHIGIAVKNLEESISFWESLLGTKCNAVEEVIDQKVKTAFFMNPPIRQDTSQNSLKKKEREFIISLSRLKMQTAHLKRRKPAEYSSLTSNHGKALKD
jgi:catechol 2,3-dioxygenase-like lactoylglutathione lyase family enzyme